MKEGELYIIKYGIDDQHVDNMFNDGQITARERERMKDPIPGVFMRYESDALDEETRALLKNRIEDLTRKIGRGSAKKTSIFEYARDSLVGSLNKKPDPKAFGYFMCDGGILRKVRLSDVRLTLVTYEDL